MAPPRAIVHETLVPIILRRATVPGCASVRHLDLPLRVLTVFHPVPETLEIVAVLKCDKRRDREHRSKAWWVEPLKSSEEEMLHKKTPRRL